MSTLCGWRANAESVGVEVADDTHTGDGVTQVDLEPDPQLPVVEEESDVVGTLVSYIESLDIPGLSFGIFKGIIKGGSARILILFKPKVSQAKSYSFFSGIVQTHRNMARNILVSVPRSSCGIFYI